MLCFNHSLVHYYYRLHHLVIPLFHLQGIAYSRLTEGRERRQLWLVYVLILRVLSCVACSKMPRH